MEHVNFAIAWLSQNWRTALVHAFALPAILWLAIYTGTE